MSVSCKRVLSDRGLCDGLIPGPRVPECVSVSVCVSLCVSVSVCVNEYDQAQQ